LECTGFKNKAFWIIAHLIQEDTMKSISPAFITATLTGLVTIGLIALLFFWPFSSANTISGETAKATKTQSLVTTKTQPRPPTPMNLADLGTIITRLDAKVENPRPGFWRFTVAGASVIAVGDDTYDRLRILVAIQSAKELSQAELMQITKSNFDTALDARYAISQDILWAIYVHPIKSLNAKQFITAIGQTVNLAKSYGNGYSSGGILFDGGDDKDIERNKMIEDLIIKGLKA